VDPSGLGVTGAHVKLVDIDRDTATSAATNNSGLYTFASVHPGRYRMEVDAAGFRKVNVTGLTLNVQDHIEQNFRLQVGSVAESVTVEASAATIDTTDATVSTVVDRQFAENLPMNGRSFQTLIELTPGVVLTQNNLTDSGQFSINGQRAASNYWMVDGVSANIGIGTVNPGNGAAGALPSFSVLGGTNSLVSVDALQEFRIQTSTYAPEFGRTPGGQISIVTRSGTNQFHGTLFDYLRNDIFDANNWFNGINILNATPIPKPKERQNDFGGTFSGPIFKDKTFFFFSYEGLRLRLPQTTLTTVPDLLARQTAVAAMQPYLNAFPFDPKQPDLGNGIAQFNASYSNPATLDAYSIRIDHRLNDHLSLFGRYDYSPSQIVQRGGAILALSSLAQTSITTQTATLGATWAVSPVTANDLRFNYSRTESNGYSSLDNFGGAVPLTSLPVPSPYTSQNSYFVFGIFSLQNPYLGEGGKAPITQRQINVVDSLLVQRGSHSLKFGVDFRRLSPVSNPLPYSQQVFFADVLSVETATLEESYLISQSHASLLFHNLGVFAQDTWRIAPRLTLTYGLRWDVDFTPSSTPSLLAVTGYNLSNLSNLALAPSGTPPFGTSYGNLAPRIGVAYQLTENQDWATVLRGGFGIFYDLATSEVGSGLLSSSYPFGATQFCLSSFQLPGCPSTLTFPLDPATAAPPPISPSNLSSGMLYAFDPNLKLPYSLEWNVALEQGLGRQQTVSASYIGSSGRRLIQMAQVYSPNPSFQTADLIGNTATSDYDALQLQFQRRLSHGLQALMSYTWSHSIDTGSAGSFTNAGNGFVPTVDPNSNRGPSDFDIRNAFSAGLTYNVPALKTSAFTNALLRDWSLQSVIQAGSAPPVNICWCNLFLELNNAGTAIRPDIVPGLPFYLYGPQYPGGKALNPAAFTTPPVDANGNPLRQGDLGRNALRGFGATQWDLAIHREFPLHEALKLQFRAEMFNVLNHPNFGSPYSFLGSPLFGQATQMLGQSLANGNVGGGAFSPLYQIGGPRSIQFALKLVF